MNKPDSIDIILSIYNALDYLKLAVKSVLEKDAGYKYRLLLIDDKSPDENVRKYLETIKDPRVLVLLNEENLGYSGTNNRGMKFGDTDVVLLNSDTEVTEGWLGRLVDCAYSDDRIGTVSPFTNSGSGLLNVPDFYYKSNPIPEGYDLDSWARTFKEISTYSYPKTMTNVGYVMYIKRKVINKIGFLDMDTYGKGYGEDNDFCLRALKAGFLNVNDDSTFIQHEGGQSFAEQEEMYKRDALVFKNDKLVEEKYPEVRKWLDEVLEVGPTTPMHQNWWFHQDFFSKNERIVHVLRDSIDSAKGGIEQFVKQIIKNNPQFDHYVVHFEKGRTVIMRFWENNTKRKFLFLKNSFKPNQYKLENKNLENNFRLVLDLINPNVVHFHSTLGYPISILNIPKEKEISSILHIHDFSIFYLPYWDLTLESSIEENIKLNTLKIENEKNRQKEIDYYEKRSKNLREAFNNLDRVFAPSEFVKNKIIEFEPVLKSKVEVVPNGVDLDTSKIKKETDSEKLTIGFIGTFTAFKGASEFLTLFDKDVDQKFNWIVAGSTHEYKNQLNDRKRIDVINNYDHSELPEILSTIDILLLPLKCSETFNFVLHEALLADMLIIGTTIGAPGHILIKNKVGIAFSPNEYVTKTWDALDLINGNKKNLNEYSKNIKDFKIHSDLEVSEFVKSIYKSIKSKWRDLDKEYKKKLNKKRINAIINTNRILERAGFSRRRKLTYKVLDKISDSTRNTIFHKPMKDFFKKFRSKAKI